MTVSSTIAAIAHPEKRLFIDLLTRDISLADAFLDLIDNSINAALTKLKIKLDTADDYMKLASKKATGNSPSIQITITHNNISIEDDCGGISFDSAKNDVFIFGRKQNDSNPKDRLSVYGIGLKRALFKMGADISISSSHEQHGFDLKLNVPQWENTTETSWTIPITKGKKVVPFGTKILVTSLTNDVLKRINDGIFASELKRRIARTYHFFLGRAVDIYLNGTKVEAEALELGENSAIEKFNVGKASCLVIAGIAAPTERGFLQELAGWFVFCNGRTVLYADKSNLTGWGDGPTFLPVFQPKHRPFLGTVFFFSSNPEELPWTTTKTDINEESTLWQIAKQKMSVAGRQVISTLDKRYSSEGTEISTSAMKELSGKTSSVVRVLQSKPQAFKTKSIKAAETVKIQFSVEMAKVDKIRKYLGSSTISAGEIGKIAFDHYLDNEVAE